MPGYDRFCIDIGGSFTDVLIVDRHGAQNALKLPAVDGRLADVLAAVGHIDRDATELHYSTTVVLNSLLQNRPPRIALLVTGGFRGLLETARLPDPDDERSLATRPRLVPLERVFEVGGRLNAEGEEIAALCTDDVARAFEAIANLDIDVVAVSLLHSYLNSSHETGVANVLGELGCALPVIVSSAVSPEQREYERTLTTVLHAAALPVLRRHLNSEPTATPLPPKAMKLMQSSGGLCPFDDAFEQPAATALSGPAAAVVWCASLARSMECDTVVTLDVGGTSTDVAVVAGGNFTVTTRGDVAGFPLNCPQVDVYSVGAGGGSVAYEAPDRRWRVGPQSAGANPGPACYGREGALPTLTDAQLVLGRLPAVLLEGRLELDRDAAGTAIKTLGATRGLDELETARGVLEIATNEMLGAVRTVAARRGVDPRDVTLFAIGGAGPQHAAELADLLGIQSVVVPAQPGVAAARGLMVADLTREWVRAIGAMDASVIEQRIERERSALAQDMDSWVDANTDSQQTARFATRCEFRYAGMVHETLIDGAMRDDGSIDVAATIERFHDYFERASGRSWRDREDVECTNVRFLVSLKHSDTRNKGEETTNRTRHDPRTWRDAYFVGESRPHRSAVYDRPAPGFAPIAGPAIIEQPDTTTIVPPGWQASSIRTDALLLTRA